jgi:cytochrome c biogenesis protein
MTSNTEATRAEAAGRTRSEPLIDRLLRLLSAVRFGLVMLGLLILSCFLGMAIMQSNVQGFDTYYETLTNSEKLVFTSLGLFNVYATWWFQGLMALTSLAIILASIDHFPAAWRYVTRPKTVALAPYIRRQSDNATIEMKGESAEKIADNILSFLKSKRLRGEITKKGDSVYVFAQSGVLNRLGPYFIHVALLTIFLSGFLTFRLGQNGQLALQQGETSSTFVDFVQEWDGRREFRHELPFAVTADKIEQRLIDPSKGLENSNTLDWITRVTITDGGSEHQAIVHLNKPYDYRGYRFFQSGFNFPGDASEITVAVGAPDGSEQPVVLAKNRPVEVAGLGTLTFTKFHSDFDPSSMGSASPSYDNPTAEIRVQTLNGADSTIPAFNRDIVNARGGPPKMANGMSLVLDSYAKANSVHYLSVQKDPGATLFYVGGGLIALSLAFTFFVPHRRLWAVVGPTSDGTSQVIIGGNANRLKPAFTEKFNGWVRVLVDPSSANSRIPDEDEDDE